MPTSGERTFSSSRLSCLASAGREMSHQLLVQGEHWPVELGQGFGSFSVRAT